ncbi:oxidoreductase [Microlunatus phosphovorus NM-1]|uniref:Oxidoreductase n=1 Tax=Microlunatus phosphovorus (strain ATCC 700054 / DSM 10555 / JCM 9379 / NBRC 101784 / NCIMB 13414 / VKM Ac-1990 / NM-1) TaxID=1032480 RepID=F5XQ80_MICPN|nr:oxidoreductase [Microlunatus phosphovorus]BAK36911.1 oxidoreductase [Microlunatus phosphovorus NM-1]
MANRAPWSIEQIPSQAGRTVVITGATSGVGQATAHVLADKGARVVVAARNLAKAEDVVRRLGADAQARPLDLADLDSVRAFAAAWVDPIDLLINNAGVMAVPLTRTAQGFELQFGTNHLGHFALTNLLLPWITDRIVCLSSAAHRVGHLDLTDLNWEHRRYRQWPAYGQSKLANLLFVLELQRRLTAAGSSVRAMAVHPGFVRTNLQGHSGNAVADRATLMVTKVMGQSPEHGAWSSLFAATADIPGGSYVGPAGMAGNRGTPILLGRSTEASDPELAKRLWTASEELTGVDFPL